VGWKPRNRSVGGVKCGVVVCVELWVDGANRHILWDRTIGDQLLLNGGDDLSLGGVLGERWSRKSL
jgi:hypothetical protein